MKLLLLSACILLNSYALCQFQNKYNFQSNATFFDAELAPDNGFIVCGQITGVKDFMLMKTDLSGNFLWSKQYDSGIDDYGEKLFVNGNGYFVAGSAADQGNLYGNPVILSVDLTGTVNWTKKYSNMLYTSVCRTRNNGFLICGLETSGFKNAVVCTDSIGNVVWSKTYSFTQTLYIRDITAASDSGFFMTGSIKYCTNCNDVVIVLKLDKNGFFEWVREYAFSLTTPTLPNHGLYIRATENGFCLMGDIATSLSPYSWHYFLMRADVYGNTIACRKIGTPSSVHFISNFMYDSLGGIAMTSTIANNATVLRMNPSLSFYITGKQYNSLTTETINSVSGIPGGYVVAGRAGNEGYLLKLDSVLSSGCSENLYANPLIIVADSSNLISSAFTSNSISVFADSLSVTTTPVSASVNLLCSTGITEERDYNSFQIYPNPADDKLYIESNSFYKKNIITVHDITGREVLRAISDSEKTILDIELLLGGIYVVNITNEAYSSSYKLIVN